MLRVHLMFGLKLLEDISFFTFKKNVSKQASSVNTPHLFATTGAVFLLHLGHILHEALAKFLLQLIVLLFQVEEV